MKNQEYKRPMPATWWLHNRYLVMFMIRELTSVFVAGYAIFLLVLIYQAGQGANKFREFYEKVLQSGWMITLQLLALAFVVFHSVTSFNAAPQIMVLWRGEEKVSPLLIVIANYGLWLMVSLAVLLLVL